MMNYDKWCMQHTNTSKMAKSLNSSLPEQYIGFYLEQIFDNIEYSKKFIWLEDMSLDLYLPKFKTAIEYDGKHFHENRKEKDSKKSNLCKVNGVRMIRIKEYGLESIDDYDEEIFYKPKSNYSNIDLPIKEICKRIDTNVNLLFDVDKDSNNIVKYIQNKFYIKTMAYNWPESLKYWDYSKNCLTPFDVFSTDQKNYYLKCPHCGKEFILHNRYYVKRKSLIPCECEINDIDNSIKNIFENYFTRGIIPNLDNSLESRRLYDQIVSKYRYHSDKMSLKEKELLKKLNIGK